jgi:hypothetical protein
MVQEKNLDLQREVGYFEHRFALMLEFAAPRRGTLAWLSQKTGLTQSKWKNALARNQRPTTEMVVALCNLRPDLARWLILGHTDEPDGVPSQAEIKLANEVLEERSSRYKAKPTVEEPNFDWPAGLENAYKYRELVRKGHEEMLTERELQDDVKDKVSK